MKSASLLSMLLAAATVATGEPEMPNHGVLMEVWDNVKIGRMEEFLAEMGKRPAKTVYIKESIDENASGVDHFGARFSAWITAPKSGEYTFYLAADDP